MTQPSGASPAPGRLGMLAVTFGGEALEEMTDEASRMVAVMLVSKGERAGMKDS